MRMLVGDWLAPGGILITAQVPWNRCYYCIGIVSTVVNGSSRSPMAGTTNTLACGTWGRGRGGSRRGIEDRWGSIFEKAFKTASNTGKASKWEPMWKGYDREYTQWEINYLIPAEFQSLQFLWWLIMVRQNGFKRYYISYTIQMM